MQAAGLIINDGDSRVYKQLHVMSTEGGMGVVESDETHQPHIHAIVATFVLATKNAIFGHADVDAERIDSDNPNDPQAEHARFFDKNRERLKDFRDKTDAWFKPGGQRWDIISRATTAAMLLSRFFLLATVFVGFGISLGYGISGWDTRINYRGVYLTTDAAGNPIQDPAGLTKGTNVKLAWFFLATFSLHIVYVLYALFSNTLMAPDRNPLLYYLKTIGRRDVEVWGHGEVAIYIVTFYWIVGNVLGGREPLIWGMITALAFIDQFTSIYAEFINAVPQEEINVGPTSMLNPEFNVMPSNMRIVNRSICWIRLFCMVTLTVVILVLLFRYPWTPINFTTVFITICLLVAHWLLGCLQYLYYWMVDIRSRTMIYESMKTDVGRDTAEMVRRRAINDPHVMEIRNKFLPETDNLAKNMIEQIAWEVSTHLNYKPTVHRDTYTGVALLILVALINCVFWSLFGIRHNEYAPEWVF